MFEAYSIGVSLKLNNLISPQLGLLSKEFEKLEGLSVSLNAALKGIGTEAAGLKSLAIAGNASNRALAAASRSAATLERHLVGIRAASAGSQLMPSLLPLPMSVSRAAAGGSGGIPPGVAGGVAAGAGGGAMGPRPGAGGHGGAGGPGGGGFHGGNIHMGPHGVGIGAVGMAAGDWLWPLAATGAAMMGGKAVYESAKDLNTEQARFKLLGLTDAQNRMALKYVDRMKIYGATLAENMAAFREAQGVGRESGLEGTKALKFAELAAPVLAKLDALGVGLDDDSRSSLHSSNIALLRFTEQSGGLSGPKEFERLANIGFKLQQSSGGTVTPEELRAMTSRGGAYAQSMTVAGYAHSEPLLAEMKGGAYGDALMTMGMRLTGGTKPTKALVTELLRLGIWDKSAIALNSVGGFDHFIAGKNPLGEKNTQLLMDDFPAFYASVLRPIYDKFGITGANLKRENTLLLGRQGGKAGNLAEKALPLMDKALSAFAAAKGIDEAGKELRLSLTGQETEFTAAWTDFKAKFGTETLPFFTGLLKGGAIELRGAGAAIDRAKSDGWGAEAWTEGKMLWHKLFGAQGLSPFVPSGGLGRMPAGDVYFDTAKVGKIMAPVVTAHQVKALSAPQSGSSSFDGRMALMPAAGH